MRLNGDMADNPSSFGPTDPEFLDQIRKMLEQMGLNLSGTDISALLDQFGQTMASGKMPAGFGFTGADTDPDAAWRTTITAAIHQLPELGADPTPSAEQRRAVADAGRLVNAWLDPHTSFSALGLEAEAWTREQWLVETGPAWRTIVQPIIDGSADALGEGINADDDQLAGLQQMFAPMLKTSASLMYREQLKRELAKLAATVLTGSELGVPLQTRPLPVLLPTNLTAFAMDLDAPEQEVLLYLTCRETARQRLFSSVRWLGPQLEALLAHYAREITIDLDFIGSQLDLENPEELSLEKIAEVGQQVTGSFFKPASTPTQTDILERLETLLALVEGWVDEVTQTATASWLTSAGPLAELIRRRRAAGDPAQTVFASLVGLELRPRRIRDAANLWAALTHARGVEGRDAVWGHPDLAPTAKDLDDPMRYVGEDNNDDEFADLDAELARILAEGSGDEPTS